MESFFRTVIRFRWLVITLVFGSTVLAALPIQTLPCYPESKQSGTKMWPV